MINVVFFGTPDFSHKFLEAISSDEEIFISGIVAQPDKPVGRKKVLTSPPTITFAKEQNIPFFQPHTLKDNEDLQDALTTLKPDVFVIIAYGKIIPSNILDIPNRGSINVHPSLLPKYRGPSPLQAAIANQDEITGISIMLIDEKMDHGPILLQEDMTIEPTDDYGRMLQKSVDTGSPLLIEGIKRHVSGEIIAEEQDHSLASFCKMIDKHDGLINWNHEAASIEAKYRAYKSWPGIYTKWNDKRLKLTEVTLPTEAMEVLDPGFVRVFENRLFIGTRSVNLEILAIQPEGKSSMSVEAFINGNATIDGANLL